MIKETMVGAYIGFVNRRLKWHLVTGILVCCTLALCLLLLLRGNTTYSLTTVVAVLKGDNIQGATFAVRTIRLPRMLIGLLAGLAFGMAGSTFQTMLRNLLASPDVIGITAGSSAAAVFCILILDWSGQIVSVASVVTGLLVSLLIYGLSRGGKFSGGRLILIGIGVQAMLRSMISYMLLRASEYDVSGAMRWLGGSLTTMRMESVPGLLVVVVLFGTIIILFGRSLRILELGEASATTLGVNTEQVRMVLVVSSVFLIAYATSVTGPLAFVAFLSGPIATKLVGAGMPAELPSALVGAVLVLLADYCGQFLLGIKLPAGVITGILGAPYLLYLLIEMNRSGRSA